MAENDSVRAPACNFKGGAKNLRAHELGHDKGCSDVEEAMCDANRRVRISKIELRMASAASCAKEGVSAWVLGYLAVSDVAGPSKPGLWCLPASHAKRYVLSSSA